MDFHDSVAITTTAAGDTAVIAGKPAVAANPQDTPARRIYVGGYVLVAAAAVTVKFKDSQGDLTGVMTLAAGTPLVVGFSGAEVFRPCAAGSDLTITLGGAVQVSGHAIFFQQ